jgi:hypothetical protein
VRMDTLNKPLGIFDAAKAGRLLDGANPYPSARVPRGNGYA